MQDDRYNKKEQAQAGGRASERARRENGDGGCGRARRGKEPGRISKEAAATGGCEGWPAVGPTRQAGWQRVIGWSDDRWTRKWYFGETL